MRTAEEPQVQCPMRIALPSGHAAEILGAREWQQVRRADDFGRRCWRLLDREAPAQQFTGVPENEFSMMTVAKMIGMDVPDISLVHIDAISGMPEGHRHDRQARTAGAALGRALAG